MPRKRAASPRAVPRPRWAAQGLGSPDVATHRRYCPLRPISITAFPSLHAQQNVLGGFELGIMEDIAQIAVARDFGDYRGVHAL